MAITEVRGFCVINTCSVSATRNSRQRLRQVVYYSVTSLPSGRNTILYKQHGKARENKSASLAGKQTLFFFLSTFIFHQITCKTFTSYSDYTHTNCWYFSVDIRSWNLNRQCFCILPYCTEQSSLYTPLTDVYGRTEMISDNACCI